MQRARKNNTRRNPQFDGGCLPFTAAAYQRCFEVSPRSLPTEGGFSRKPKEGGRIVEILLVEDNPADVRLIKEGQPAPEGRR